MYWEKLSSEQMNQRVEQALSQNTNFSGGPVFGIPGSWLNREVFPPIEFLKEAPFLRTMVENPNHIGCHTSGESEKFFEGTQAIEREVIRICAEEILDADKNSYDGYIATGGTEGNLQAVWCYRNYFLEEDKADISEIAVIYSQDTHYSLHKACNLMCLEAIITSVDEQSRQINREDLKEKIEAAKKRGIRSFIAVLSMGTTMFGSVDDLDLFKNVMEETKINCLIHVDAAFGGFIYPFSDRNKLKMSCLEISSFSLDGHKMLQSPYGTGIFLIKKPFLDYVSTEKASYVKGFDQTLCGSRSGALSVAMWMIFCNYGSEGWRGFVEELLNKTDHLESGLRQKGIVYFREPGMNVITINSSANSIELDLFKKYHWVADNEKDPTFFKAVIMDHVESHQIESFLQEL